MKRFLKTAVFLSTILCLSNGAFAESPIDKGVYTLSGSAGYNSTSNENSEDIETVKPFASISYEYLKSESEFTAFSVKSTSETTINAYEFGIGADYFLAKNVALEPFIAYRVSDYKNDSGTSGGMLVSASPRDRDTKERGSVSRLLFFSPV